MKKQTQKTAAASSKARRSPQSRASAKLPVNPPHRATRRGAEKPERPKSDVPAKPPHRRTAPRPATPQPPTSEAGAVVPTAAPPLLIVTLDAEASACVREFAKTFGYEPCDVTSGIIMDELPQALQEWDDCRTGKGGEYFIGCIEKTVEARTRRRAASRLADGPSYTRREIALALCAFSDDCRRMGWMQADMRFSEAAAQIAEHGLPEIIIGEKGIRMKTPMRKD